MERLPYFVIGGALFVALVASIVIGEPIVFLVVLPIVIAYAVVDNRLKRRESPQERAAAEPPD
jgi:hypothetical protein